MVAPVPTGSPPHVARTGTAINTNKGRTGMVIFFAAMRRKTSLEQPTTLIQEVTRVKSKLHAGQSGPITLLETPSPKLANCRPTGGYVGATGPNISRLKDPVRGDFVGHLSWVRCWIGIPRSNVASTRHANDVGHHETAKHASRWWGRSNYSIRIAAIGSVFEVCCSRSAKISGQEKVPRSASGPNVGWPINSGYDG